VAASGTRTVACNTGAGCGADACCVVQIECGAGAELSTGDRGEQYMLGVQPGLVHHLVLGMDPIVDPNRCWGGFF
jgi:hypothetical protein